MPIITRPDGRRVEEAAEAASVLTALGLEVSHLSLPASAPLAAALERRSLGGPLAGQVLADFAPLLPQGYAGRDVIALFPDAEGLEAILAAFHRCHVHDDDEVRLILAGAGVFGFVLPDGDQVEIAVAPGDLIAVPAGTEHWFRLDADRTIVALRLFGAGPDWRARFTETPIRFAV